MVLCCTFRCLAQKQESRSQGYTGSKPPLSLWFQLLAQFNQVHLSLLAHGHQQCQEPQQGSVLQPRSSCISLPCTHLCARTAKRSLSLSYQDEAGLWVLLPQRRGAAGKQGRLFSLPVWMLLSFPTFLLSPKKSFDRHFKKRQYLLHPYI